MAIDIDYIHIYGYILYKVPGGIRGWGEATGPKVMGRNWNTGNST